jgi:hypothetical protein
MTTEVDNLGEMDKFLEASYQSQLEETENPHSLPQRSRIVAYASSHKAKHRPRHCTGESCLYLKKKLTHPFRTQEERAVQLPYEASAVAEPRT